jgi:hypothetical protein
LAPEHVLRGLRCALAGDRPDGHNVVMSRQSAAILAATVVLVAAVVVLAVALSSGGGSVRSGSTPSNDRQYIAKANLICQTVGAKTGPLINRLTKAAEALISSSGQNASPQVAGELRQLSTTANDTLARLRALKSPAGGTNPIQEFLTPFATVTTALSRASTAAGAGQLEKALLDLEAAAPSARQMTSAAKAKGLTACASALALLP